MVAQLVLSAEPQGEMTDLLNELLIAPGHQSHQQVARALQKLGSPSTIPFVKRAIDGGSDHLDYTCSPHVERGSSRAIDNCVVILE